MLRNKGTLIKALAATLLKARTQVRAQIIEIQELLTQQDRMLKLLINDTQEVDFIKEVVETAIVNNESITLIYERKDGVLGIYDVDPTEIQSCEHGGLVWCEKQQRRFCFSGIHILSVNAVQQNGNN